MPNYRTYSELPYYSCESRYVGKENKDRAYFMPYLGYEDYANQCSLVEQNGYQSFTLKKQKNKETKDIHTRHTEEMSPN